MTSTFRHSMITKYNDGKVRAVYLNCTKLICLFDFMAFSLLTILNLEIQLIDDISSFHT